MEKVFFSPGNECRDIILHLLNHTSSSLKICVFTISDDLITKTILHRQQMGIRIRIITDNGKCYDKGSDIAELCRAGIEVRVDKTSYHMHHKFAIFDNETVLTGSYNWTRSAALYNHENLILSKDKQVVKKFSKEFDQLWDQMADY